MSDPWDEVMILAKKHGFVCAAHGGKALLMTHENQKKQMSENQYRALHGLESVESEKAKQTPGEQLEMEL